MKVKRESDGKVFEFDFRSFGRGRWSIVLTGVDGSICYDCGDPVYPTERAARKAARARIERYRWTPHLGWFTA